MRILLTALALSTFSFQASANFFDSDSRKTVTATRSPWSAVGVLWKPNGTYCTAVLIGARHLLTAASCVIRKDEKIEGEHRFNPGYAILKNNKAPYTATAEEILAMGDADFWANNWAIVKLNWDIGDVVGFMGMHESALPDTQALAFLNGKDVFAASYGDDRAQMQWEKCGIREIRDGGLSDCSITAGSAGSPIFYYTDKVKGSLGKRSRLLGIIVSEKLNGAKKSVRGIPYSFEYANGVVLVDKFFDIFHNIRKNQ